MRKVLPRSRTMEFGCDIRVALVITTCTRNTEILLWMVRLNKCTTKWHLVTESGVHASRLLRLPPSQLNFAKGRAPSSSTTPKSSFHWFSRRLGPQLGSSKQHTRHPSPTCSCNSQSATFPTSRLEAAWFIISMRKHREGNHIVTNFISCYHRLFVFLFRLFCWALLCSFPWIWSGLVQIKCFLFVMNSGFSFLI